MGRTLATLHLCNYQIFTKTTFFNCPSLKSTYHAHPSLTFLDENKNTKTNEKLFSISSTQPKITQFIDFLSEVDKRLMNLKGLRQCLANKSPLKMMKNVFYFTSKVLFVVKIFKFLSSLSGHVEKRLN